MAVTAVTAVTFHIQMPARMKLSLTFGIMKSWGVSNAKGCFWDSVSSCSGAAPFLLPPFRRLPFQDLSTKTSLKSKSKYTNQDESGHISICPNRQQILGQ